MRRDEIRLLDEVVKEYLHDTYRLCSYNKTILAKHLNITRRTIINYAVKYDLDSVEKVDVAVHEDLLDNVKTLELFTADYIRKCYRVGGVSKGELANRLGINVRTLRMYANKYRMRKQVKTPRENVIVPEYSKDFYCMQPVTKEQRDDWYNRNYF